MTATDALTAALAEVIADHEPSGTWRPSGYGIDCSCGRWWMDVMPPEARALYEAHLAAVLAPLIDAERAAAWRAGVKYGEATALGHAVENLVLPGTTPYDRADNLHTTTHTTT